MSQFFLTKIDDGYGCFIYQPTVAGYIGIFILILILLLLVSLLRQKDTSKMFNTKSLVFAALAITLSMVTSFIKIIPMPMGGSVTLLSMLFVSLIGYWYGLKAGLSAALAYGLLQLVIDPYIVSIPQLFFDYVLAYGSLGLSGLFYHKKNGLILGYLTGVAGRLLFSVLSGVIFFSMYAPDAMNPWVYSISYNGFFLGAEAIITIIILALPPVRNVMKQTSKLAGSSI